MDTINKEKIREIIRSYRLKSLQGQEEENLVNIFYEITSTMSREDAEWKATVATKEDIKMVIELMEKRFEAQQREMDKRFEAMDKRFESVDKRFESVDKRFESVDKRFESVDKRFEDLNNRFNSMQWLIGVGFSLLAILMAVFKIF